MVKLIFIVLIARNWFIERNSSTKNDYNLIFVDVEGHGPAPMLNDSVKFEFGAVEFSSQATFHGVGATYETFEKFADWLDKFPGRQIFVSDNPAYDWQFINYYFHFFSHENPFGWSARRISDYYAGLVNDWYDTQSWKKLRITPHTHHPVDDAMGNVEAFKRILNGER
jgi:hypothetical protein